MNIVSVRELSWVKNTYLTLADNWWMEGFGCECGGVD